MHSSTTTGAGYTAIILAGKRPGVDPVAAAYGETYKAKVKVNGAPMLTHVVSALCQSSRIKHVVIVAGEALGDINGISGLRAAAKNVPLSEVRAQATISDSVLAALLTRPAGEQFLITASDHPLLTAEMIDDFLIGATKRGISIAFVERQVIERAHPGMRRTYLSFKNAKLSGANLFAISGEDAIPVVKFFQRIEANRKSPLKMAAIFGPANLIGFLFRAFTPEQAFARLSKILNCAVHPVRLDHANAAVDVDRAADLDVVERLFASREANLSARE
jgi:molybdopterin-guanine dinucleotide biosynthesis protein A